MEFKEYRRKQIAELRSVNEQDIEKFEKYNNILVKDEDFKGNVKGYFATMVSLSEEDRKNESPKIGDMIARNPKNHNDQWLIAKQYFEDNFEEI